MKLQRRFAVNPAFNYASFADIVLQLLVVVGRLQVVEGIRIADPLRARAGDRLADIVGTLYPAVIHRIVLRHAGEILQLCLILLALEIL